MSTLFCFWLLNLFGFKGSDLWLNWQGWTFYNRNFGTHIGCVLSIFLMFEWSSFLLLRSWWFLQIIINKLWLMDLLRLSWSVARSVILWVKVDGHTFSDGVWSWPCRRFGSPVPCGVWSSAQWSSWSTYYILHVLLLDDYRILPLSLDDLFDNPLKALAGFDHLNNQDSLMEPFLTCDKVFKLLKSLASSDHDSFSPHF